jgi:transposase-like protein
MSDSMKHVCVLVVVGALRDGTKELLALQDGERESKQSWTELLVKLKHRGLSQEPALAIGDGALGFWSALEEQWPGCQAQRCSERNVVRAGGKNGQPKKEPRT